LLTANKIREKNSEFVKGSIYDLSPYQNQYDFAYVRLVFQHLENPQSAMTQVFSVLKPGGKILILDSDESLFNILPHSDKLTELLYETQTFQAQRGGDRFVGSKLKDMIEKSGFLEVKQQIFIMTPENMGRETFLNVTLGFRPQLFDESAKESAITRTKKLMNYYRANMMYGHNGSYVVRGRKQSESPC